jgi:hypothetical protein
VDILQCIEHTFYYGTWACNLGLPRSGGKHERGAPTRRLAICPCQANAECAVQIRSRDGDRNRSP